MPDKSAIVELETRVRRLLDDHRRLSDLCTELTAQRDSLQAANRTLQQRVSELQTELTKLRLVEGMEGSGRNPAKARARVNRLMREVDRCIALLELSEPKPAPTDERTER